MSIKGTQSKTCFMTWQEALTIFTRLHAQKVPLYYAERVNGGEILILKLISAATAEEFEGVFAKIQPRPSFIYFGTPNKIEHGKKMVPEDCGLIPFDLPHEIIEGSHRTFTMATLLSNPGMRIAALIRNVQELIPHGILVDDLDLNETAEAVRLSIAGIKDELVRREMLRRLDGIIASAALYPAVTQAIKDVAPSKGKTVVGTGTRATTTYLSPGVLAHLKTSEDDVTLKPSRTSTTTYRWLKPVKKAVKL